MLALMAQSKCKVLVYGLEMVFDSICDYAGLLSLLCFSLITIFLSVFFEGLDMYIPILVPFCYMLYQFPLFFSLHAGNLKCFWDFLGILHYCPSNLFLFFFYVIISTGYILVCLVYPFSAYAKPVKPTLLPLFFSQHSFDKKSDKLYFF